MKSVQTKQKFKPVPGYDLLFVGDLGSVYSMKGKNGVIMPKKLNVSQDTRGYSVVYVDRKQVPVHRLVMSAFLGGSAAPVRHLDKDKSNNNITNLEYIYLDGCEYIPLPDHILDKIDYYIAGTSLSAQEIAEELNVNIKNIRDYIESLV